MKFATEQRVIVPGQGQVQGVVTGATETMPGFPVYMVEWLTEKGERRCGTVGEGDLMAANPPLKPGQIGFSVEVWRSLNQGVPVKSGAPVDVAHRLKGNRRKVKVKAKRKR